MGDQARLRTQDHAVLQRAQAVIAERSSGRNQIDDQIGVTNRRGHLQGSFGMDQASVLQAVPAEECARQIRKFGRYPKRARISAAHLG